MEDSFGQILTIYNFLKILIKFLKGARNYVHGIGYKTSVSKGHLK